MNQTLNIKQKLYNKCIQFVNTRLNIINKTIQEIQESLTTETKSSAGDKHETGRAMLQLEREKIGHQLAETQKLKETLSKITPSELSTTISLGSVVYTSQNNYFIAVSAGEIQVNKIFYYAISVNTPIGKLLIGKTAEDEVCFRELNIKILEVL